MKHKRQSQRGKVMKMRKVRELLRLHFECGISYEKISLCIKIPKGGISHILERARSSGVDYQKSLNLKDKELRKLLYPKSVTRIKVDEPDFPALIEELKKPKVTRQLLWEEYQEKHPEGMGRTTFFERLSDVRTLNNLDPRMRGEHRGGEKLFLDYSGDKAYYTDRASGQRIGAELFVCSWGASSYCYVEASASQQKEDWIASNVRALRFFNCSPLYLVPDNLKSAVIKADFYDPEINATYDEFAQYYNSVVLPARARKPRDKAVVEANVGVLQNFILGRLRNQEFYSLEELNAEIQKLLKKFNDRPMQEYKRSRSERFEELDRPFARSLPVEDFSYQDIHRDVFVGEDYHVKYRNHYYSVPWTYTATRVEVWLAGMVVQFYHEGLRIASHVLAPPDHKKTTLDAHRPPNHLFVQKLKPLWVLAEAAKIGPDTQQAIHNLIEADHRHPETAVRKALGIVELRHQFPAQRVEKAVGRALLFAQISPKQIRELLEQGLDEEHLESSEPTNRPCWHENIRGANFYHHLSKEHHHASGTNNIENEKNETLGNG